jgi:tRNA(fMet)-specific endonuclease VapC
MTYVLDTSIVSALMRGEASVVARLKEVASDRVSVPYPVLAEIEYGIERLPRSRRRDLVRGRYDLVAKELRRAPWNDAVSRWFGIAKAGLERTGHRLEDFDVAIAAHALATGATLVTANRDQMARIPGLEIEGWT